jgi:hypothetical protein
MAIVRNSEKPQKKIPDDEVLTSDDDRHMSSNNDDSSGPPPPPDDSAHDGANDVVEGPINNKMEIVTYRDAKKPEKEEWEIHRDVSLNVDPLIGYDHVRRSINWKRVENTKRQDPKLRKLLREKWEGKKYIHLHNCLFWSAKIFFLTSRPSNNFTF